MQRRNRGTTMLLADEWRLAGANFALYLVICALTFGVGGIDAAALAACPVQLRRRAPRRPTRVGCRRSPLFWGRRIQPGDRCGLRRSASDSACPKVNLR